MKNVTKLQIALLLVIIGLAYLKHQASRPVDTTMPEPYYPSPSLLSSPEPLTEVSPAPAHSTASAAASSSATAIPTSTPESN